MIKITGKKSDKKRENLLEKVLWSKARSDKGAQSSFIQTVFAFSGKKPWHATNLPKICEINTQKYQ